MSGCSALYGWQGRAQAKTAAPDCSRAKHAELINKCGKMMYNARRQAYAWYSKECRAWGREPLSEPDWFKYANGQCGRLLQKQKGGIHGGS